MLLRILSYLVCANDKRTAPKISQKLNVVCGVDCTVAKVHMCLLSLNEWSIFSFLLSWIYKMHLVGWKTALEEVAKGDVNKINDTATPEENKKFNEHKHRKDAAGKTMYCSVDTILSFCMCICKWHVCYSYITVPVWYLSYYTSLRLLFHDYPPVWLVPLLQ